MPRFWSGSDSGLDPDTLSDPVWRGSGRPGWGTPHPPLAPQGVPDLPGILPKTLIKAPVPGIWVPEWFVKPINGGRRGLDRKSVYLR